MTRSLSSGFIAIGEEGTIVELNTAAREILGIAPDVAAAGRKLGELTLGRESVRTVRFSVSAK